MIPPQRHRLESHPCKVDILLLLNAAFSDKQHKQDGCPFGVVLLANRTTLVLHHPPNQPKNQLIEFIRIKLQLFPRSLAWAECYGVELHTTTQHLSALRLHIQHQHSPRRLLVYQPYHNPEAWWVETSQLPAIVGPLMR